MNTLLFRRNYTNDERAFHQRADEYFNKLVDTLEDIGDKIQLDGYDVAYSSGVLTLALGKDGVFVLNKQPPNKQIWLSSPVSGPKRFDHMGGNWVSSRDKESLKSLLDAELSAILKMPIETPN